jgi:hypothetical protein
MNNVSINEIRRLKQLGYTHSQVAKQFGVTQQHISYLLKPPGSRVGRCERCRKHFKALNYHHVNYITDEIEKLCSRCHRKRHRKRICKSLRIRFNADIPQKLLRDLKKATAYRRMTLRDWLIEKATGQVIEHRHAVSMKENGK